MRISQGLYILGLIVGCSGFTFTVDQALEPATPVQTEFTVDTYIQSYLKHSLQVKRQANELLNAKVDYQNAFVETFLPSFSLTATTSKSYSRPNNIRSWREFRHADSQAQAFGT